MSEQVIVVKQLHKHFDKNHALKGIDLQVNQGEMVALLGPQALGSQHCLGMLMA